MFMGTTEGSNKKLNDLPAQYRFPTLANLQSQLNAVSKKVRTSQQILYNDGALVGPACGCFVFGIDYSTGNLYYKDENGQWVLIVGGGGGGIFDATVEFSVNADPNDPGTTFNPNTPGLTTVLYISTIDFSQWTYDGVQYNTYVSPFWTTSGNPSIGAGNFIGSINNAALKFRTNNTQVGVFDTSGNFGINKLVPTEKLDVDGNVRFSGALMPNNSAGTAGQYLTSAGAGLVPTWTSFGGVLSLAAIGAVPNANGATISTNVLNLQPASASFGGVISMTTQTMGAGNKTFGGTIGLNGTAASSAYFIRSSVSSTGFARIYLTNTNAGIGAGIGALYENDVAHSLQYYMGSAANSYIPDGAYIHSNGNSGFRFVTSGAGAKVRWSTSNAVGLETGMYMRWDNASMLHTGIPALTTEDRLLGYVNASGDFSKVLIGTGLLLSGGTLSATGGAFALTNGNGTTANGTAVDLGGTLSQNTNIDYSGFNLVLEGTDFNDSVAISDGSINLNVGDTNRHAHLFIDKLATGSNFQAFIDSTGSTLFGEIDGVTNDVANTGMWNMYIQETGVFYSNLLLNETGATLRAGTTSATAKGLFIDLAGTPYLDIVNNDNTETKFLTWNSVDKKVEYRDFSSLTPSLQQVTTTGNTTSDDIILDAGGADVWFHVKNSPAYTLPFISVGGGIGGGLIKLSYGDTYINNIGTAALTSNRTINFPDATGTVALTSDIPAAGANTALSNLAAVAINTSLISDTDNTDDLGSAAIAWKDAYLRRILLDGATSGTVTVQPAGVAGTWTLTLPTTDGNSGELLQTDGSGATSWVDTTTYFSNRFGGDGSLGNPITPIKVTTTASSATPTPDADASTMFTVTALAANAVFAAPTGTPVDGQDLLIRIKDNATPRTLGWNAIYRAGTDFALPTTTVASETMYIQFIYNAADATWDAIGLTQGF